MAESQVIKKFAFNTRKTVVIGGPVMLSLFLNLPHATQDVSYR